MECKQSPAIADSDGEIEVNKTIKKPVLACRRTAPAHMPQKTQHAKDDQDQDRGRRTLTGSIM